MIVLLCTISTLLAAFVVSQLLPVKYEASSRLLLDVARPDPVTGEVIATSQAKAYSRTQVELVRDQRVAGYAVQKLRLASDPKVLALAEDGALPQPATQRSLTDWLIEQTKAQLVDGSNVLAITVTAPDGELAQRLANALREGYVEATVGLRGERTARPRFSIRNKPRKRARPYKLRRLRSRVSRSAPASSSKASPTSIARVCRRWPGRLYRWGRQG
jgi:uncharacterized protein involved in exopolysaccharide biosynthesis